MVDTTNTKHAQIDVQDFDDIKSGYRIIFHFRDNPWFEEGALEKTFKFDDEGRLTITATAPSWKPDMVWSALLYVIFVRLLLC